MICTECLTVLIKNEFSYVCTSCGLCYGMLFVNNVYDDNFIKKSISYYSRYKQFRLKLREIEAKRICGHDVINKFNNIQFDTIHQLKRQMKIKKLSKYNKYIYYIYKYIKKKPVLTLSDRQRGTLMTNYSHILKVYNTLGKKNMINVHYVITRLCIMNGYDHITPFLFNLKLSKTLDRSNKLWDSICTLSGWDCPFFSG